MEKRLVYPQYNQKGQRDVYNVTEDRNWLRKTSSGYHPQIQAYIDKAKPMPSLIQVLLTALGAHEFWGQNVNGDRFYEQALKNPGSDYGYKTFLTNANYFTHHVNKDPSLAKGKVLETVWNDQAKRVELIVGINPALDPDAASMLDNGESLCFSMGARLPYDVCTVCANKARTRAEYCDHLKYQMNQIDPASGMLVGAVNPFPKFFDISRVLIPADKTAYMWEKIAHAANHPFSKVSSAQLAEIPVSKWEEANAVSIRKTASVQKSAEIKKIIPAIGTSVAVEKLKQALSQVKHALDASSTNIPKEVFSAGPTYSQCLNSMAFLGMSPTVLERKTLVDIFTGKDGVLPPVQNKYQDINLKLIITLAPYAPERSFYRPVLLRRLEGAPLSKQAANVAADAARGAVDAGRGIAAGVMTALGSIFGVTGNLARASEGSAHKIPEGLAGLIAKHPVLAGVLAAIVYNKISPPKASKPVVTGNFTVADPTRGFYNNDWQRRFIEMQNRPAAVIKTGAANEIENLVSPLTYLLLTSDLEKTAEQQRSWNIIAQDFIDDLKSKDSDNLIKSAQRAGIANPHEVLPIAADFRILNTIMREIQ